MALLSLSKREIVANSVMLSLAVFAVALRTVARRLKKVHFWIDDYLIFAALILAATVCSTALYAASRNLHAQPNPMKSPKEFSDLMKIEFINVLLWYISFGLIKVSILFFYQRIFVIRKFRIISNVLIGVVVLWALAGAIVHVCRQPPPRLWDIDYLFAQRKTRKQNIDYENYTLTMTCINMVLDVAILVLPIPFIRTLQMKKSKKVSLFLVFGSGAFVVVASAVRIYYVNEAASSDSILDVAELFTWNAVWGNIEVCASIVAACLPTLAALITQTQIFIRSIMSRISLLTSASSSQDPERGGSEQTRTWSADKSHLQHLHKTVSERSILPDDRHV